MPHDKTNQDILAELYPDEQLLVADGYDAAIIGVVTDPEPARVVYSVKKILEILAAESTPTDDPDDDPYTSAREHYEYNIVRSAAYLGPGAPIFCEDELLCSLKEQRGETSATYPEHGST